MTCGVNLTPANKIAFYVQPDYTVDTVCNLNIKNVLYDITIIKRDCNDHTALHCLYYGGTSRLYIYNIHNTHSVDNTHANIFLIFIRCTQHGKHTQPIQQ